MASRKRDLLLQRFRVSSAPQGSAGPASSSTEVADARPTPQPDGDQLALVSLAQGDIAPKPINGAPSEQTTLWGRAYRVVATSDPAILRPFEEIYSAPDTSFQDDSKLQSALEESLRKRDEKALVLSIAGKSIHVRQQGEKVIKFVIWSKDWITSAVSHDPHAALAWMSVSLLLPLILRPSEQNTAMLDGLNTITELLTLYKIRLERYYAHGVTKVDFEDNVVEIFAKIVEYQARCIRHLNRPSWNRLAHNIGGSDDWKQSLESIQAKEQHIQTLTGLLDKQEEDAAVKAQLSGMASQVSLQETIVRVLNNWGEEQRRTRVTDDMQKCLHALSSPYREEKDFNKERVPNTCEWLLQSDEIAKWRNTDGPSVLWISADPGCGKSVLSKCLVDEKQLNSTTIGSVTCYFFFKDGLTGRRTMADALAAILHQLFCAEPALLSYAVATYQAHGSGIRSHSSDLWDILVKAANDAVTGEIVILIDALDECEPEECSKLLHAISKIVNGTDAIRPNLKFCMTSRPYTSIETAMMTIQKSTTYIRVPGEDKLEAIGREIDLVITAEVPDRYPTLSRNQQQMVMQMLKSKQNRTYLWLYLVMNAIKHQIVAVTSDAELVNLINKLPSNVQDAYAAILDRSPSQEKAKSVLKLVVAARRPLTVQELMAALIVSGKDSNELESIVKTSLPDLNTAKSNLKNICGLLLAISNDSVYLLHETVREFLLDTSFLNNDPTRDWQHFEIIHADAIMARVCIIALNAVDVIIPKDLLSDSIIPNRQFYNLYEGNKLAKEIRQYLEAHWPHLSGLMFYAANYWHFHAENGLPIEDPSILRLSFNILEGERTSCIFWFTICEDSLLTPDEGLVPYTPLTLAALYNQAAIIQGLVNEGHDVNCRTEVVKDNDESTFGSALGAAIFKRHLAAIKMLLKLGSNVNEPCGKGRTPLLLALNNKQIFAFLIENGADINAKHGKSALEFASRKMKPEWIERCIRFGAEDYDSALEKFKEGLSNSELDLRSIGSDKEKFLKDIYACLNMLNDAASRSNPDRERLDISNIISKLEWARPWQHISDSEWWTTTSDEG